MKKLILTAVALAALTPAAVARVRAIHHPAENCSYSLAPTWGNDPLPASGLQRGMVLVYGQTALCSRWLAYSSAEWVTVEAAPTDAQPAAYVTVAANPTPQPRTASLTIAGIRLSLTQAAAVAPPVITNLVKNGSFDTNLANWGWQDRYPNARGTASWTPLDAHGKGGSGSILLSADRDSRAFQRLQCVPVSPRTPYRVGAMVRTGATTEFGEGVIAFVSYRDADCSGSFVNDVSLFPPPLRPEQVGVWQQFSYVMVTGSSARALGVVVGSASNVSTFDTWFDDVFVEP